MNAHYRPSGDKVDLKKYNSKYALRTYNNPEHSNYSLCLEVCLDSEHHFNMYCDWEDRVNDSILYDGLNASRIRPHQLSKWSFSYLHELSFIRGIVDSGNTDEQVCVWKEH